MELKFAENTDNSSGRAGSNRTFMELKLGIKKGDMVTFVCSNRTFMELKCIYYTWV